MEIEKEKKEYLERECWKCTDYIKHNPVLYPRVGDIFLRELFALANPQSKAPYSRRKKVQMDTIWYLSDESTLDMYETGCKLAKVHNLDQSIWLKNGNEIPFFVYWYLICLFFREAANYDMNHLSKEWLARVKKDKLQKGICKSDSRKYFKAIGMSVSNVAADFPISKNYCPLNRELCCKEICPKEIRVGDLTLQNSSMNYRTKEELLYLYAKKEEVLPKGVIAAELLYAYMTKEYNSYFALMLEQNVFATIPIHFFNCQLYDVFAYLADALYVFSLKRLFVQYKQNKQLKEELEKEELWQLSDMLNYKNQIPDNALSELLLIVEEELETNKGEE